MKIVQRQAVSSALAGAVVAVILIASPLLGAVLDLARSMFGIAVRNGAFHPIGELFPDAYAFIVHGIGSIVLPASMLAGIGAASLLVCRRVGASRAALLSGFMLAPALAATHIAVGVFHAAQATHLPVGVLARPWAAFSLMLASTFIGACLMVMVAECCARRRSAR
ncbi:hypothetical protein G3580_00695 [Nitrogeniibacter mangrovi]|uniref:Uncharacterized protein n=1 Tax=Nitrogeniibacter mangrovi TaxID=2016596 RepID=A0A6C1AZV6_9RHOO|nr:hypothetical protein [Nitrogeniibacter mangrovi]QID16269.1 hypothetical protein G3580_00695 [Nitrogeniibacter mangrovi]